MDRGAWWAIVHGVTRSQTQLSNTALHSKPIPKCIGIFPITLGQLSYNLFSEHPNPFPAFNISVQTDFILCYQYINCSQYYVYFAHFSVKRTLNGIHIKMLHVLLK